MESVRWIIAVAALGVLPVSHATAQMATTIASNTAAGNAQVANNVYGQSFTVSSNSPAFNSMTFSFLNTANANVGAAGSKLYLFADVYSGTPTDLPSASSLGSATFNNGVYSFAPSLTLTGGTKYFAYADTPFAISASTTGDRYSGGDEYIAQGGTSSNFRSLAVNGFDARFVVTGVAATPEPATWSLMILGFGAVGVALRRKRATLGRLATA